MLCPGRFILVEPVSGRFVERHCQQSLTDHLELKYFSTTINNNHFLESLHTSHSKSL